MLSITQLDEVVVPLCSKLVILGLNDVGPSGGPAESGTKVVTPTLNTPASLTPDEAAADDQVAAISI